MNGIFMNEFDFWLQYQINQHFRVHNINIVMSMRCKKIVYAC